MTLSRRTLGVPAVYAHLLLAPLSIPAPRPRASLASLPPPFHTSSPTALARKPAQPIAAQKTLERAAFTAEEGTAASVAGMPEARFFADSLSEYDAALGARTLPQPWLVLSGGGENGAFSAGILKGWTAAGTRPDFAVVTGVSTGALIAPFAFAGSRYDEFLEQAY